MVHAFITSRIDYCITASCMAPVPFTYGPYRMYLTLRHDLFSASENMTKFVGHYIFILSYDRITAAIRE